MDNIAAAKQTDLLALVERTTTLKKVAAHEWAGACPRCGGRDRFRVDPTKGWFCRQCHYDDKWHDAIDFVMWYQGVDFKQALIRLVGKGALSSEELERRARERKAADDQRKAEEFAQMQRVRDQLNSSGLIETYYANPKAIEYWIDRGLSQDWVDYYRLGYCAGREWGDEKFVSDSLTIPYWRTRFDDTGCHWYAINLRHRLLKTDAPGGKYRPHFSGAGNHLFYTDPMTKSLFGDVLIVEGEIKAMVTWALMWEGDNLIAPGLFVVGLPGKSWKADYLPELAKAKRVFICLDPDATADAERLAAQIGKDRANVFTLPDKIDDLINMGVLGGRELLSIMNW